MEDPTLLQSYVRRKYFVSTALRWASTDIPMKYFETIAWELDPITNQRDKMILGPEDSGSSPYEAFENHNSICIRLAEKLDPPSVKDR